jgi:iron(III) transport system ATP-binding protein
VIVTRRADSGIEGPTQAAEQAPFVAVRGVSKVFPAARGAHAGFRALDDVTLSIERGAITALVGPSGSGKTTLLRCVAGLERPTAGTIEIGGAACFSSERRIFTPANRRNVGLIFQSYALWPQLTVAQNVEYPLARRRVARAERRKRAQEYLELVGCGALGDRYPHEVSGGQQQRVALARTLVYEPPLVLFDEPLSNVDLTLREQLRRHIRALQTMLGFTGVFVTHDQHEAYFMGDRVAIMQDGRLLQVGTPTEVHTEPASLAVATFSGAANLASGELVRDGAHWLVRSPDVGVVDVTGGHLLQVGEGATVTLAARPEQTQAQTCPAGDPGAGTVTDVIDLGTGFEYVATFPSGRTWRAVHTHGPSLVTGTSVRVTPAPAATYVYAQANADRDDHAES